MFKISYSLFFTFCFIGFSSCVSRKVQGTYYTRPYQMVPVSMDQREYMEEQGIIFKEIYSDTLKILNKKSAIYIKDTGEFKPISGVWEIKKDSLFVTLTDPIHLNDWKMKFIFKQRSLIPIAGSYEEEYYRSK